MTGFQYARPTDPDAARAALAAPGAYPIGGGTDLLLQIQEGMVTPSTVVDLRTLPGATEIERLTDGSVRIGSAVSVATLSTDPLIRELHPLLAEAAGSVGTPALREMGTVAGNLAQRPRCWYLRSGVSCFKSGGSGCPAVAGEHQYHGILDEGHCRAVHPSDPAVALVALEAEVECEALDGSRRRLLLAELFAGAATNPTAELSLAVGERIVAVEIPAASSGGIQRWEKLMQRGAWDFALVSCAAIRRTDGAVRLVLGGVGAAPWRIAESVEEDVGSGGLDEDSLDALAERAMYDTAPLEGTAYKVTMAQALLRRAMRALGATA